jgi:short-subunit dehydrogenase
VARSHERVESLAHRLGAETGQNVKLILADLSTNDDVRRVEDELKSEGGTTLLVNNAGFGPTAALLDADINKMENMIALNVIALTRLTYAAVPASFGEVGEPSSTWLPLSR